MGKRRIWERRGATDEELKQSRTDVLFGMLFSNLAMYFIILATASTLFKTGKTDVGSAAEVAKALEPLAGRAAGLLFAAGVIGVGFLAVPVMTAGAAFDLCQTAGWKYGLSLRPEQAKRFYGAIVGFTLLGVGMNFLGFNPMKALVVAGIVQGFATPPLMMLIMFMTSNREIMGERVNGRGMKVLGWATTAATFAATAGLVATWFW